MNKTIFIAVALLAQMSAWAQGNRNLPFSIESLQNEIGADDICKYVYILQDIDKDGKPELLVKEKVKEYNEYYVLTIDPINKDVDIVAQRSSGGYEDFSYTDDGYVWHYEEHTGGLSKADTHYKIENSKVVQIAIYSREEGQNGEESTEHFSVEQNGKTLTIKEDDFSKYTPKCAMHNLYDLEGWQEFDANDIPNEAADAEGREICRATGDLNKDGREDLVVVTMPRDTTKLLRRDDGYVYDFNQPIMSIYFNEGHGSYVLWKKYPNTLPYQDNEFIFVEDLAVDITQKGVLRIKYGTFASAGSWSAPHYTFLYRFQNGDFFLIGEDCKENVRNTGETIVTSTNYLTGKQQIKRTSPSGKTTEKWQDITKKDLEPLGRQL